MNEKTPLLQDDDTRYAKEDISTSTLDINRQHEKKKTGRFPWNVLITAILVCSGGSLSFGYQLTVMNPSEWIFRGFINETVSTHYGQDMTDGQYRLIWSVVLNLLLLGAILGTLPLMKLSETLGRQRTFYVSTGFNCLGLLIQCLSKVLSFEILPLGRFVSGFGCSLASSLEPMYLTEISPVERRGFFGSMTGIFFELGFILGGIMALPAVLGSLNRWPWMFGVEIIPVVMLLLLIPFMRESPRYLLARGRRDDCRDALIFFGHQDVESRMQEISMDIHSQEHRVTLREVWQKVHLRRAAFLGTLVASTGAMSGITAIDFFSTSILTDVGLSRSAAQYASVAIFVQCLISAVIGSFVVERTGRRRLLLITTFLLILTHVALMALSILNAHYPEPWAGGMSVAACIMFALTFGMGPSVLQWSITSEMVPQNARSAVQSIAMIVQKVIGLITGFAFYPLQGVVGPYAFLLFTIPLIIFFCNFIKMFPETKKKTVVEVMRELGYKDDHDRNFMMQRL